MASSSNPIFVSLISIALLSVLNSCGGGSEVATVSALSIDGDLSQADAGEFNAVAGNDGPSGDSGLTIDNTQYSLNAAIGDIWGANDSHFQIDFTLTNGNFMLESIERNGQSYQVLVPAEATAVVRADIYNPGDSFHFGNYAYMAADSAVGASAGVGYFTQAFVGVDTNEDGRVGDEERFDVIDGIIEFKGTVPYIVLGFSMTLLNGQNVTGEYTGLFDFAER